MMKRISCSARLITLLAVLLLAAGCSLTVGNKVVGIESGQFFYSDGMLKADHRAAFDRTWAACEKTVADMKAVEVEKKKKIGVGTIDAVINEEKVHISLEYVSKNITSVGVRAGVPGNSLAAKLIQEKIKTHLEKN